jgi:hypothetical protein
MSYQEKNTTVSFMSYLLIFIFYLVNWVRMYQTEGLIASKIFALWVTVIVATIIVNIIASILTNIIFSILHAIKTRSDKPEQFIADERDQLIDLKGTRISYVAFSIGVGLSMLAFVLGQPPLITFSLIVLFSLLAEMIGDVFQIVLYRKGF